MPPAASPAASPKQPRTEAEERAAYRRWFAKRQAALAEGDSADGAAGTSNGAEALTAPANDASVDTDSEGCVLRTHDAALDATEQRAVATKLLEPLAPCVQRLEADVLALLNRERATRGALKQLDEARATRHAGAGERALFKKEQARLAHVLADVLADSADVQAVLQRAYAATQLLEAALDEDAAAPQSLYPRTVKVLERECAIIGAFASGASVEEATAAGAVVQQLAPTDAAPAPPSPAVLSLLERRSPLAAQRTRGSRVVASFVRQRDGRRQAGGQSTPAWHPDAKAKAKATGAKAGEASAPAAPRHSVVAAVAAMPSPLRATLPAARAAVESSEESASDYDGDE